MQKVAYVFPGQGSQTVGMGKDLYDNFAAVRDIFKQANEVLGFAISEMCFEGPSEELKQTINTQPALLTASYSCLLATQESCSVEAFPKPAFIGGHSLGEYTALIAAGVCDFKTAVYLAKERGRLMHEASSKSPGSMAAILGLEEDPVSQLCEETGTFIANINCPGQIVISGAVENVKKAVPLAKEKGALRAIMLQVSGAFHSPLMRPAADIMAGIIDKAPFENPRVPIIGNTSARPLTTTAELKTELVKQLYNCIRWSDSIKYMTNNGVDTFIEIGPGKVLTGLTKRITADAATFNLSGLESIQEFCTIE